MINIPILLTAARIIIVPFLVHAILMHDFMQAVVLLLVAALSDALDGALARILRQETVLGAALDPVADKLLVVACYAALMKSNSPYFSIPSWLIALVIIREVLLLLGAGYLSLFRKRMPIAPTYLGKVTTAVQLFFIGSLLLMAAFELQLPCFFEAMLLVVAGCVIISLMDYIRIAYTRVIS
jgi:cardiolipin synthase